MATSAIWIGGEVNKKEQAVANSLAARPGEAVIDSSGTWTNPSAAASSAPVWGVLDIKPDQALTTAYADGELASALLAIPRYSEFNVILKSGENVAKWATLEFAANGEFQAVTTGLAVAVALEAVNASGGAARIKVMAIA